MAEQVHDRLEDLLPVFEELNRIGLFSETEVKNLIRKCTAFEYKLVRLKKFKEDFIQYSQYNINLLELIAKRRKKLMYYFKKDEIEYLIIARIHRLMKTVSSRWPADIKLWLSHVKFCEKWNKRFQLSKIWTTTLKYHANKPYVWVMAAQSEVKEGNFENARNLFFQALRHHPKDKNIWLQYFRMEVISITKTKHRLNTILGSEIDKNVDMEAGNNEAILKAAIAKMVYQNAKSIHSDVKFRCDFLHLALQFLPFVTSLVQSIIDDITTDFFQDATARSVLAMIYMHPVYYNKDDVSVNLMELEDAAFKSFDQAVVDVNDNKIYDKYIDFIFNRIETNAQDHSVTEDVLKLGAADVQKYYKCLNRICAQAVMHNKLSVESCIRYVDFLVQTGNMKKAQNLLIEMHTNVKSVQIEIRLLELKVVDAQRSELSELLQEFEKISAYGLTNLNEDVFYNLWVNCCISIGVESNFRNVVLSAIKNKSELVPKIKCDFLRWSAGNLPYKSCQKIFRKFLLKEGPVTKELFMEMISISEKSGQDQNKLISITKYYDHALDKFGKDDSGIWLSYINFATKYFPIKVTDIHWKAKHNLNPDALEEFFEKFSAIAKM